MKIVIVCAMKEEADGIKSQLSNTRTENLPGINTDCYVGKLHGLEVVCIQSGIGLQKSDPNC